jgi:hypothetical protein
MPEVRTCTPAEAMAIAPCAKCASESELRMIWLWFWATMDLYDLPEDLAELLEDSACWTCLSETDIKRGILSEVISGIDIPIGEVMDALTCIRCLKPKQVEAAIAYTICDFLSYLYRAQ